MNQVRFSGARFTVEYHLSGTEAEARAKATALCLDQSVELPDELIPPGPIRDHVLGQVERLQRIASDRHEAVISFPCELLTGECGQLLNVVFGIASLKPGVRVWRLSLTEALVGAWAGPRFGRVGLRERVGVPSRPLVCGVLKPLGLASAALADLAYQCAMGGLDLIKDDQAFSDHPLSSFEDRVARCAEAVSAANRKTGLSTLYVPNVTGPREAMRRRALFAKKAGAGGVMICPGLTGFDALQEIAGDDAIDLPILCHPALLGSYVVHPESGMAPAVLYGQLPRLAGADATIYPNFGGAFPMREEDCRQVARAAGVRWGSLRPIFPTAAGRLSLDRVGELCSFYEGEVILILGSGIYQQGNDVVQACRAVVTRAAAWCR